ncbi:MAG: TetR/AcrR family transcriptional regulator [Planctomycetaceae bacterium]|nr:TetR/AcrR family transcriptional regulator [Planctomycetaceae bacterium]
MVRPRSVSDDQIRDVACRVFLERGPGVATDQIASELGVTSQALLKRFHTKRELFIRSLIPTEEPAWRPLVEDGPDSRPVKEQLADILHALAGFFADVSKRMSVLRLGGVDPAELMRHFEEPPPVVDIRVLAGWFGRAYDRGLIRNVDFEAAAMQVLTSMHGPVMLTDMLGEHPTGHSTDEYVDFLADVLLHGLAPHESVSPNLSSTKLK